MLYQKLKELLYKQYLLTAKASKFSRYIMIFGLMWFIRNILCRLWNKYQCYPPGPLGIPVFGCLFSYIINPRKFRCSLAHKYGAITFVPFLSRKNPKNIFISHPNALRQLYINEKILDRPDLVLGILPSAVRVNGLSFVAQNGEKWSRNRKYASLTVLGLTTNTSFVLSHVKLSINEYIDLDPKMNDDIKLWYPKEDMSLVSFNNIFPAIFNQTLPKNDPFILKYSHFVHDLIAWLDFIVAQNIPSEIVRIYAISKLERGSDLIIEWMRNNGFTVDVEKNILFRNNDNDEESNKKSDQVYIDFLISKLNENEASVSDIIPDIGAIMIGAIDTTSAAAEYGFLLLAKYPDIQEMVYNELQNVMKKNNLTEFDFKILNQLHIFRAFIHEVLRISSVGATGIPHKTNQDHIIEMNERKMVIPKNTICHTNIYFMNKFIDWNDNNKIFAEENNSIHFEYWLDDTNDNKFKMNDNFVVFGAGKRNCVGQTLAKKALYAIFGLMMNKYKFKTRNGMDINIKQKWGTILAVDPPIAIQVIQR